MTGIVRCSKRLDLVHCDMAPGAGLFFHCNLLHRSDRNGSADRRWTLICCYNAARNNPTVAHHHPFYTRLDKVGDDAIRAAGLRGGSGGEDVKTHSYIPPQLGGDGAQP